MSTNVITHSRRAWGPLDQSGPAESAGTHPACYSVTVSAIIVSLRAYKTLTHVQGSALHPSEILSALLLCPCDVRAVIQKSVPG